jgi:hypothetical protein
MNHPTYETLIDYLESRLPELDQARVAEHLSRPCRQCNNKIEQLHVVLETMAANETVFPPPGVLERAIAAYQERPPVTSGSLLQVLAELVFDSHLQLSPAALRGAAHTHQMLFATQQVDIDLNIMPDHREYNLVGQILDREQANEYLSAFVSLQSEAGTLISGMEVDTLGQFTFRHIPSGVYDLVIDLGGQEVSITGLEFGNV